jgi:hypothetical protein
MKSESGHERPAELSSAEDRCICGSLRRYCREHYYPASILTEEGRVIHLDPGQMTIFDVMEEQEDEGV